MGKISNNLSSIVHQISINRNFILNIIQLMKIFILKRKIKENK